MRAAADTTAWLLTHIASDNLPVSQSGFSSAHAKCSNAHIVRELLLRCGVWRVQSQIKVRVVCARAYHALFMYNMMIRPTEQELAEFGKPDFTIFNAGAFPVNRYTSYMSSSTSVDVNLRCPASLQACAVSGTNLFISTAYSVYINCPSRAAGMLAGEFAHWSQDFQRSLQI